MTDGTTDIPCTSPSGKGHFTRFARGFDIRFPGLGLTGKAALGWVFFFIMVIWLGVIGASFSSHRNEPLASLLSPELFIASYVLMVCGLIGIVWIVVNETVTLRLKYDGQHLQAGRMLNKGELVWQIPVDAIQKVHVQSYRQGLWANTPNFGPAPASTKEAKILDWSVVHAKTDQGRIALMANMDLDDMHWTAAIINQQLPMQPQSPVNESMPTPPSQPTRQSLQAKLLIGLWLLVVVGILVLYPWYFSTEALPSNTPAQLDQLMWIIKWLIGLLLSIGLFVSLIWHWAIYKHQKNKPTRQNKPTRPCKQPYRVKLTAQMLENK